MINIEFPPCLKDHYIVIFFWNLSKSANYKRDLLWEIQKFYNKGLNTHDRPFFSHILKKSI